MIYLDNAATTLYKPQEVDAAILDALHTAGNPGRGAQGFLITISSAKSLSR